MVESKQGFGVRQNWVWVPALALVLFGLFNLVKLTCLPIYKIGITKVPPLCGREG